MSSWPVVAITILALAAGGAALAHRLLRGRERRARRRQALEINDSIVQGLARVKWALEAHRPEEAQAAADETLARAQTMVTDLLRADSADGTLRAGSRRRDVDSQPACARAD